MIRKDDNNLKHHRITGSLITTFCMILCMTLVLSLGAPVSANAASVKTGYIAHRGYSAKAPENTLAAFRLAAKNKGFYGVEFDIWEAASEEDEDPLLLVMHDRSTKRTCNRSADIRKISRSTLNRYTITRGSRVKKYKGQKIPTAEQALDTIYSTGNAVPVVELKHRLSGRALRHLLTYIGDRQVVIISFDFKAVRDAARMSRKMGLENSISTMYLMKRLPKAGPSATIRKLKKAGIGCISLKYTSVNKKTVRKFHKAGLKVCVWTVPNKKTAKRLKKMKVDYITANGAVF